MKMTMSLETLISLNILLRLRLEKTTTIVAKVEASAYAAAHGSAGLKRWNDKLYRELASSSRLRRYSPCWRISSLSLHCGSKRLF